MLKAIKDFNNLSPELRKRLNEDRANVGKVVKYKFYIAKKNPDAQNTGGELLYPALYTLTPVTYVIMDPGDQLPKNIGLAKGLDQSRLPYEEVIIGRVTIPERFCAILSLDLTKIEHIELFEYLEMHPKMEGGKFRDKNIPAMCVRVDELKEAKTKLARRELRSQALTVATRMGEPEVRDFAAAMNWNELDDLDFLREKLTALADTDPEFFRKFIEDPRMEYKAIIRRAIDANVISWLPVEAKFTWTSNGSTIAMLERSEGDKYFEQMADWLMVGKNGAESYKKIKALLAGK